MSKIIVLYREDFSPEAWEIICNEFDADMNGSYIMCTVDENSISQDI